MLLEVKVELKVGVKTGSTVCGLISKVIVGEFVEMVPETVGVAVSKKVDTADEGTGVKVGSQATKRKANTPKVKRLKGFLKNFELNISFSQMQGFKRYYYSL